MRVVAVINQKGGVGKTTTVANLGAALADRGQEVWLVDLDPQANLTLHLGVEPGASPVSLYEIMTAEADLAPAALPVGPGLRLLPSTIDLAAAEMELVSTVGREVILRDRLAAAAPPCQYVLIDCPPSLGLLTINALAAADEVLIPLQPHFLALQGLGKLLETIALVQRRVNPRLKVAGVVLCLYDSGTRLAAEVSADVEKFLANSRSAGAPWSAARVFRTLIRRNVKLAECPSHGKTIFDYEPSSHGAADYRALAEEFAACFESAAPPPVPEEISRDSQDAGDEARELRSEIPDSAPAAAPEPSPARDSAVATDPSPANEIPAAAEGKPAG